MMRAALEVYDSTHLEPDRSSIENQDTVSRVLNEYVVGSMPKPYDKASFALRDLSGRIRDFKTRKQRHGDSWRRQTGLLEEARFAVAIDFLKQINHPWLCSDRRANSGLGFLDDEPNLICDLLLDDPSAAVAESRVFPSRNNFQTGQMRLRAVCVTLRSLAWRGSL